MSLYSSSVKRPITTALVFAAVAIFGIFSLMRLSTNLLPEIETNSIMVMTTYPGASAADIETNVTKPLENALNSVSGLKHVISSSKENISIVTLQFNYGVDIEVATNDVRDKLDMVTTLPDGVQTPILFKFGADDIPILILSVSAKESMPGLYKILDEYVSTPLARISGVGTVSISGIPERQIQVYCDPFKLEGYGLSIETIASVIAAENRNLPAGSIDIGSNTYSMRVQQEFTGSDEMKKLVVGHKGNAPIYLSDVAVIKDTQEERAQEVYVDGAIGGTIIIQKQSGANSVDISKQVFKRLPQLQKNLPSDVNIGVIVDTSDNIINTVNSLKETIFVTFIIVMLVVLLFLERWRATFVVVLTIPISLLAALIYLLATGNTLNIISMSALSIAIGMVVDNAIVVLENITTHIERGSRPRQAAVYATNEVAISVIASTLTTIAVFLPLTMIQGMAGILFRQLGWMVSIILAVSTIGAITLTPMLCSQLLRLDNRKGKFQGFIFKPVEVGMEKLTKVYLVALNWAVRHRWATVLGALGIFVLTMMIIAPRVKTEYFPTQDNGRVGISIQLPVGTRQEVTREVALRIDSLFKAKYPEIKARSMSEGAASSDNIFGSMQSNGTNIISFNLSLVKVEERDRGLREICDEMRTDLAKFPEIKVFKVMEGGSSGGGVGGQTAVDIEIYGYDFAQTDEIAALVRKTMMDDPQCSEATISRDEYTPEYQVLFDREKLALHGLNVTTASTYLRNRINGNIASYYREDGDEYDIVVRYAKEFRSSIEDIENITIYNSAGNGVKIRDLGKVIETQTPPTIERKDRQRLIKVSAVASKGVAMSDLIKLGDRVMSQIDMPNGLTWQYGGSYEDQQDTFKTMYTLMVLMIILVFIVMAAQFESLTYPFVIMFSIPFALVGVMFGLWITGTPMGVMALMGILMLIGVVVNNGIVLIDYIRLCRERGMGIITAVITAGKSRLRPILMTTLTTVFGMIPLAVATGTGSEMWKSLGMTVAWGLSLSTLITLILIPVMYCLFASIGVKRQHKQLNKLE